MQEQRGGAVDQGREVRGSFQVSTPVILIRGGGEVYRLSRGTVEA